MKLDNISRRRCLKGAGAAALAVAAAGVLAGCDGNSVIEAVTTEDIQVILRETDDTGSYDSITGVTVKVKKGDKLSTADIEKLFPDGIPGGLMISDDNDNLQIDWENKQVIVNVCEGVTRTFKTVDSTTGNRIGEFQYKQVPKTKTSFTRAELEKYGVEAPDGYKIMDAVAKLEDGVVLVGLYK